MAFIIENNITVSFADFNDVVEKDQRLFEANEGLTQDVINSHLIRSTERILDKFRTSSWWRTYYTMRDNTINTISEIPAIDPDKIKDRLNDFTDLCVYIALSQYILPRIADFSTEDNSERQKMSYYETKAENLFQELIQDGDWYDFDGDGTISNNEKQPGKFNLKRVR